MVESRTAAPTPEEAYDLATATREYVDAGLQITSNHVVAGLLLAIEQDFIIDKSAPMMLYMSYMFSAIERKMCVCQRNWRASEETYWALTKYGDWLLARALLLQAKVAGGLQESDARLEWSEMRKEFDELRAECAKAQEERDDLVRQWAGVKQWLNELKQTMKEWGYATN